MNQILKAVEFAANKHTEQRRKNTEATPYINHPIEVAAHLSRVGGIDDEEILIAALLHDTIEDTETTREEIEETFGARVAAIVAECTDDKRLEQSGRKRLQIVNAPFKSPEVKLVKIADKTCNLKSVLADPPVGWSTDRQRDYFIWAEQVVRSLLGVNEPMDQQVLAVIENGHKKLAIQHR